jgi:hypothetical protein
MNHVYVLFDVIYTMCKEKSMQCPFRRNGMYAPALRHAISSHPTLSDSFRVPPSKQRIIVCTCPCGSADTSLLPFPPNPHFSCVRRRWWPYQTIPSQSHHRQWTVHGVGAWGEVLLVRLLQVAAVIVKIRRTPLYHHNRKLMLLVDVTRSCHLRSLAFQVPS